MNLFGVLAASTTCRTGAQTGFHVEPRALRRALFVQQPQLIRKDHWHTVGTVAESKLLVQETDRLEQSPAGTQRPETGLRATRGFVGYEQIRRGGSTQAHVG